MTSSAEYPDLRWMPPKSWTNANRTSIKVIVIHTTEGSARGTSAEDGAAYDQRRTDGTSTHYFHDNDSTIQCVRTEDQAHAARANGNRIGIQHELCTHGGSANWADAYHQAMLHRAAKQAARDAYKWGIPVRRLSPIGVKAGHVGFCGHADITEAFPQDKGTHTDPGKNFPWRQFLGYVQAELTKLITTKEDEMPTPEEYAKAVWTYDVDASTAGTQSTAGALLTENRRSNENRTVTEPEQADLLRQVLAGQAAMNARLDEMAARLPENPAAGA